jgi:hypothetical protein
VIGTAAAPTLSWLFATVLSWNEKAGIEMRMDKKMTSLSNTVSLIQKDERASRELEASKEAGVCQTLRRGRRAKLRV